MSYKLKKLSLWLKENGLYTKNCPITALKNHKKVTLYTDEEAGELVKEFNKKF